MCIIVIDEQEIICGVDYSFNCRNVQIVGSHVRRKEVAISEKLRRTPETVILLHIADMKRSTVCRLVGLDE